MTTKTKRKLCWNCEGNVSVEDETCPYCGVSVEIGPIAGTEPIQERFASPFKKSLSKQDTILPIPPYSKKEEEEEPKAEVEEPEDHLEVGHPTNELQQTLLILTSLLLGTVLSIFGIILLLFSDKNGVFTLRWHGNYWYLYLIIGVPLIYFGWRTALTLSEDEPEE